MSAQVLPEDTEPLGRGLDVTGERFGLLVAVRPVGKVGPKRDLVWLFQCWCGRYSVRPLKNVRSSLWNGHVPQCSDCRDELSRGAQIERRQKWNRAAVDRYRETGAIWSWNELEFQQALIHKSIEEDIGYSFRAGENEPKVPIFLWDNEGLAYRRPKSVFGDGLELERDAENLQADYELDSLCQYGKWLEQANYASRVHRRAS